MARCHRFAVTPLWKAVVGCLGALVSLGGQASEHWAFEAVRAPEPPAVEDGGWCRNSVDRFLWAQWAAEGRRPGGMAGRRMWIRRASFDLTGLPPTAEEVEAFEADAAPDAWARCVDRLLDSPRYGEQWGRHWLDVVRYADTAGETADYPVPAAWRYRNYVIQSFNADKPYDEFLREQIAGDLLARDGPRERYAERVTATGFLAISRRFGFDSENYHHLTIQDTIDTLGQSVLGLTLGCARCHAHKYDPVSMPDYYALYGIFESTRYAFPGSEQKQRMRALTPLAPPEESAALWAAYEQRLATLAAVIERQGGNIPGGALRSLDALDGDFEMQAPAAGGSKGVLVPPWVSAGMIAVQTEAQSPFKNLHPLGRVGAHIPGGTNRYRIAQALRIAGLREGTGKVFANLDCRVATNDPAATGSHRFRLGSADGPPAVEVLIGQDAIAVQTGPAMEILRVPPSGQWFNVQLELDLSEGTVSGAVGVPGDTTAFAPRALAPGWNGRLDWVAIESSEAPIPALSLDNLGVQTLPIAPVSFTPASEVAAASEPDVPALEKRLREVAGMDGDFELQSDGDPPMAPWQPGPNSVVTARAEAQSPLGGGFPEGRVGIRLPNSGAYNGFGRVLPRSWRVAEASVIEAGFDFRCADTSAGGDGAWRFYLGHGPGSSAAVEIFINGREFFRRSADARDGVAPLTVGEWYRVRLKLDLGAKRYTGTLSAGSETVEFSGEFAVGWDGVVDNTFIDSYGHLPGVKPALDADNFVVREQGAEETPPADEEAANARRTEVTALRQQIADAKRQAETARREMESLIAEGPLPMAYAVSEGTPRNARVQLRGEPDRPGEEVARGLLPILAGGPLPGDTRG
ncbi:MAG: DUF1549 domain-containing protein, partial [Verrucomicrobiae bacterium]|nr:DUF1549 domain-containing protein [Verrucomicrobiae bacterium]